MQSDSANALKLTITIAYLEILARAVFFLTPTSTIDSSQCDAVFIIEVKHEIGQVLAQADGAF